MHTRTWQLDIRLVEHDDHTRADAVLLTDAGALSGPAHGLLDAAIADVTANDPAVRLADLGRLVAS